MTNDPTWPSVYFAYLFFALMFGLALYFFVRTVKAGYWGRNGEDVKHHVFLEDEK
ncbi:MAG: hypothetical protein SFV54_16555 [Bryobacteraceae bacterium]|nr:hypothetical protein [Bryobacteraceae bacterium]